MQGSCSLRRRDCFCKRCTELQGYFLNTAASTEGLGVILLVPLEGRMPLAEHLSPDRQRLWDHCPEQAPPARVNTAWWRKTTWLAFPGKCGERSWGQEFKNIIVCRSQYGGVWHKWQNLHSMKHWGINTAPCRGSPLLTVSYCCRCYYHGWESLSFRAFQTTPLWFRQRAVKYCI